MAATSAAGPSNTSKAALPYATVALYDQLFATQVEYADAMSVIVKAYDDQSVSGDDYVTIGRVALGNIDHARQAGSDLNLDAALAGTASDIRDLVDSWDTSYTLAQGLVDAVANGSDTQTTFRDAVSQPYSDAIALGCMIYFATVEAHDEQLDAVTPVHFSLCSDQ